MHSARMNRRLLLAATILLFLYSSSQHSSRVRPVRRNVYEIHAILYAIFINNRTLCLWKLVAKGNADHGKPLVGELHTH